MDKLHSNIYIIPTQTDFMAIELAELFFEHWYCENSLLTSIVDNQDKMFVSRF